MLRKRGIAGIVAAVLLAAAPVVHAKCSAYRCGDVNDDCEVNIGDAVLVLRASVGLEQLDEVESHAADVAPATETAQAMGIRFVETVGDGAVNVGDAVLLLRRVTGLEAFVGCYDQPVILSVSPQATCGNGMTTVTAAGERLCWDSPSVFVGGEAVTSSAPCAGHRFITFQVPDRPGLPPEGQLVDVVVRSTRGAGVLREALRLMPPCSRHPVPASLEPGMGVAHESTRVTLRGSDLRCLDAARLEGAQTGSIVELTSIVVVDDEEITATIPRLPLSIEESFDLVVSSGCEERVLPAAWRYWRFDVPAVRSLTPPEGGWRGGEAVVADGHRLNEVAELGIGRVRLTRAAGDFISWGTGVRILAMPPSPDPSRETQVSVLPFVDGVSCTGMLYTYGANNVSRCIDLIETSGPVAGGTLIGIAGDDLDDVEAFLFGARAAPARVLLDDYRALVVLPEATGPGAVRVGLQRGGVVVDECDESFTYE